MPYFYLAVAAVAPILLIFNRKRFLGSQTHPAAVFILSWILCGFLLSFADAIPFSRGAISFVWVAICFPIVTLLQKRALRQSSKPDGSDASGEQKP